MDVVIDDRLLLAVLLRGEPAGITQVRRRGDLYTTGLWYHRLCRAVAGRRVVGRLSGELAGAPPEAAAAVVASIVELPSAIRLISLRDLAWPMGAMGAMVQDHRLNVIALEALSAARRIRGAICVDQRNAGRPLVEAAEEFGVPVVRIAA
jgi:hypothetical protein